MFERCDANTMTVFDTALAEAHRLGHHHVGTEHLLIALIRHRRLLPDAVAELLPGDAEVVIAALAGILDGPTPRDAELLKTLGIDLDEVRSAVRQTFGETPSNACGNQCTSRGNRGGVPADGAGRCSPAGPGSRPRQTGLRARPP